MLDSKTDFIINDCDIIKMQQKIKIKITESSIHSFDKQHSQANNHSALLIQSLLL